MFCISHYFPLLDKSYWMGCSYLDIWYHFTFFRTGDRNYLCCCAYKQACMTPQRGGAVSHTQFIQSSLRLDASFTTSYNVLKLYNIKTFNNGMLVNSCEHVLKVTCLGACDVGIHECIMSYFSYILREIWIALIAHCCLACCGSTSDILVYKGISIVIEERQTLLTLLERERHDWRTKDDDGHMGKQQTFLV